MPAADLRALAGKVGLLKPCPDHGRPYPSSPDRPGRCPAWCGRSDGVLPTEVEVRAAIFEAGVRWIETGSSSNGYATAMVALGAGQDKSVHVHSHEAAPEDLVLLALLRALEACRG